MAESSWPETVELSAYVADVDTVQLKVRVPAPVVVLVADLLSRLPRRVGVRSAGELIAATLVASMHDLAELGEAIGDYRETRAGDVLPTEESEGEFSLPSRAELGL